jgi:ATP-dependent DNA helicase RecQ
MTSAPDPFAAEAQAWLARLTGRDDARFRPQQLDAIRALVDERRRVLLVQRTGWGKSAVYFVATRLLRDRGAGPTILLSPLLALMRNQIDAARRMGLRAVTINSTNTDDWDAIQQSIADDEIDLLLISAQRLANAQFQQEVLPVVGRRSGAMVVDEAHCISDWGHDFNPDYRRIGRVLDLLPRTVPVLACTATANDRVVADVEAQLGANLTTLRGPLGREGLELSVLDLPDPARRLAWLAQHLPQMPGTGIVYCLTVRDAEQVASWLRSRGIDAPAYHGSVDALVRERIEAQLLANEVPVVVATSALGMGFDKPDVAFVVHYQAPGTPVAYYQQVGRAGRALDRSVGVLLRGAEDDDIQDWFIRTAFPPQPQAEAVVALLEREAVPVPVAAIEAEVNVRRSRLEAMLKILEVEGAVERVEGKWRRTLRAWSYDTERVEGITALRREEQQAMRDYAASPACRMEQLRRLLDDPLAEACGVCDACRQAQGSPVEPPALDETLVAEARQHLRAGWVDIEPRKMWPAGLSAVKGRIRADDAVQPGRALAQWGDGGYGSWVRHDKAELDPPAFRPELVDALADLVRRWSPDPAPVAVTWVPSLRVPALVAELARGLARRLDLPAVELVAKVAETAPQKEMENSAQQAANLLGAFEVVGTVPSGPVLLVDDVVDSRWTFTVVGRLLRRAGCLAVHPVALASATAS